MAQRRTTEENEHRISVIRKGQAAHTQLKRLYGAISLEDMKKQATAGSVEFLQQYEVGWDECVEWWRENQARFLQTAYSILGDFEDAEDAVSDLLFIVWEKESPEHLEQWCMTVLKRKCFDKIKARKSRPVRLNWASSEDFETSFEEHPEAIKHAIEKSAEFNHHLDARLRLDALCLHLRQDEKDLIKDYLAGNSHTDIADSLNISEGNARVRFHHTLEHLRELSKSGRGS